MSMRGDSAVACSGEKREGSRAPTPADDGGTFSLSGGRGALPHSSGEAHTSGESLRRRGQRARSGG